MMVTKWSEDDVDKWLNQVSQKIYIDHSTMLIEVFAGLNGKELLAVTEAEIHSQLNNKVSFVTIKKFIVALQELKNNEKEAERLGHAEDSTHCSCIEDRKDQCRRRRSRQQHSHSHQHVQEPQSDGVRHSDPELRARLEGTASTLKPEVWKAFLSLCYVFLVTWITAVVMVIVHDKVPDMKKYPPLPDLFLDNVPHIPWAFDMCEITGSILMAIWVVVLVFHKHRFILLRRFFALSGTVFLLRCITMLITSLSVPGGHLKCAPRSYPSDVELYSNWSRRLSQAYAIWTGAGMSVRGVRTCGDYMFSGHTVALTLLNFFITEYTSRSLYLLHIATWLMNMFGIFFILAAHEHYSIDVFIAFYITSRLFLYYHTLSNNQALMQGDSLRTRIWFPLLSFFESEVDGIVPNEYESPLVIFIYAKKWIVQFFHEMGETSVARFAGNSLRQQATMVDFSVAQTIDKLKKVLVSTEGSNKSTLSDKNIQASMPVDSSVCHMHYCTDAACRRERIFDNSSQNSAKKVK